MRWFIFLISFAFFSVHADSERGWLKSRFLIHYSAQEHLNYGLQAMEKGQYQQARYHLMVVRLYAAKTDCIAKALYALGKIHFDQKDYERSNLYFSECFEHNYQIKEVIDYKYQIASILCSEEALNHLWGVRILPKVDSNLNFAKEILTEIVEWNPTTVMAQDCLLKIIAIEAQNTDFQKAVDSAERFIQMFPLDTRGYIALADIYVQHIKQGHYRYDLLTLARLNQENFLDKFPLDPAIGKINEGIKYIQEEAAAHAYKVASFFNKKHLSKSAQFYYGCIKDQYPDTQAAVKSIACLKQ